MSFTPVSQNLALAFALTRSEKRKRTNKQKLKRFKKNFIFILFYSLES
jgi:hypothetical protein